jgi:WD40 repeat protein/DNA-binding SARP family transcriptional activator
MEFRILGPLEVRADREAVPLGGIKPRTLLAVLLLQPNEPVSAERLALALWGDDAPPAAVRTVQVYVSRLRKALGGGDVLETTPAGYRLNVRPGELDRERFEDLVEAGRGALAADDAARAAEILREALGLWRGPPLAELTFENSIHADVARLEEQRIEAVETRVEADLAAGREAELVGELRQLVALYPTRERLAGQLMLALYRCGRQADALESYNRARRTLVEDVGIEPGRELRRLHEAILHQDATLEPAPAAAELPQALDAGTAPALEGRGGELAWLRERWEATLAGPGSLVAVIGARGAGKTRLAAELAGEAHAEGSAVLYAAGGGPAEPALAAIARARAAAAPTLLVVDDIDRADVAVLNALTDLPRDAPVLALGTGEDVDALRRLGPDASLQLAPLGLDAVRAIGVAHAPPHVRDEVPAARLLEESDGIARRVHTLARQWARREAAARVREMATTRSELRSMEQQVADDVEALEATRPPDAATNADDAAIVCPFKGLASFQTADARYFFGRERLVAALVARLVGATLLGIVGPSGSGKSSALQAGLLPALAGGVLPGSDDARQIVMRPGAHPLRELRRALDDAGPDGPLVLAVDQFEETFTRCRDEAERAGFVEEILGLADAPCTVIVAVRADHYGRCAAYPALSSMLAANHVLVGPMRDDELRRAVECPARRAGLLVEPELVDALVGDVTGEPGALPLLSTALLELWQQRDGRRLRHATYERTGGVRGAVARLAEDAYGRLDDDGRAAARNVLLHLADVRDDGTVERRRLPLEDLGGEDDPGVSRVVARLADSRLLTVSAGTVELAHEALLREWPRLRRWIDDDRDTLRLERSLSLAADEWERLDRDDGALLRGARLAEARVASEHGGLPLPASARDFLDASLARFRRDRAARRRRLTFAFAALAVGLVAITVVAGVAVHQAGQARDERDTAISRELALQSGRMLNGDPELGVRLALLALDKAPTAQAGAALRQALPAFHPYTSLTVDPNDANAAAYSPDGRRLVTGGAVGAAIWDVATHRRIARLPSDHGAVQAARFSPSGDRVALGFQDGAVAVTDASLRAPRDVLGATGHEIGAVAFSGNGKRLAAALGDGTVRVLATDGGGSDVRLSGHKGAVLGVDISRDGRRVASAGKDGSVRLWSLPASGASEILHDGDLPERDVVFSPDGSQLMAVGDDRRIRFWDARTGAAEPSISGEGRELISAAFSADSRRFAAAGFDGTTRVWRAGVGPPVAVLRGQHARILDLGFGPTEDRVVTAGDDGTVRLWDAGRTQAWTVPSLTYDAQFNRDGRSIVTGSADGTARVWNPITGEVRTRLDGPDGPTLALFSPVADTVVVKNPSAARLWPVGATSATVAVQLPKGRAMYSAELGGNGKRLLYVDDAGHVVVRDLASGRDTPLEGGPKKVNGAVFSPDGRYVAAAPDRDVVVWRVDRPGRPISVLSGHRGSVNALDISRDDRIVTAGADGTIRIWDTVGHQLVTMQGNADEVTTAIFTRDGKQVLSSGQDGTVRLFDARTGTVLAVLRSAESELYDVALSRDGNIATLGRGEVVRVSPCDFCGSLDRVRALALSRSPRPLSAAERKQFLAAAQ